MPELVEEESPNRGVQHVRQQNLRVHAGAHQEEAHDYVEMIGAPNTKRKKSEQFIAVKAKRKMQIRNTKYRL